MTFISLASTFQDIEKSDDPEDMFENDFLSGTAFAAIVQSTIVQSTSAAELREAPKRQNC